MKNTAFAFWGIVLLASVNIVFAGIFRHDVAIEKYQALANQPQFECVGRLRRAGKNAGSAVIISSEWATTAAHIFENAMEKGLMIDIGGKTYNVTKIVIHPNFKDPDLKLSTDLALIKIDGKYNGTVANLYEKDKEQGAVGTIAGFGNFRSAMEPNSRGAEKLAGQNMIDAIGGEGLPANYLNVDMDSPTDAAASSTGDSKPLELEYIMDGGDSGGGFFIRENGKWFLAGSGTRSVHSMERLKQFEKYGFYGSRSYFTRLSVNVVWIKAEMKKKD